MKKSMELLNKLIPSEILKKAYSKRYRENEIISKYADKSIIYIVEGIVVGVRYEEAEEIFCSLLFKRGDFLGLSNYYLDKASNWEFLAVGGEVEVIVFPERLVTLELLKDYRVSNYIHRQSIVNAHKVLTGYYIFARGGAKAFLAYLIILNSEEDVVYFGRYSDVLKMMGISESMLYRITREFIEKGLIIKRRRKMYITNREALMDYYREYVYSPSIRI